MHPVRKQRLQVVILIFVGASIAAGLIAYMLGQNANYFYTPSQVARGEVPTDITIRAGGMVVAGSIERSTDSLEVSFMVSDGLENLKVTYSGILPDLFAEGEAAVATGRLNDEQILYATQVLAKHDENYIPPEVADAMKKASQLKQQYQSELQEALQ